MLKQTLFILFFISSLIVFSETSYEVLLNDNSIVSGYIIDDKPGEVIVLESDVDGEIIVLEYKDIVVVKVKTTGTVSEPEEDITNQIIPQIIPEISLPKTNTTKIEIIDDEIPQKELVVIKPEFSKELIIGNLGDMSLIQLNSYKFKIDDLIGITPGIKLQIYDEIKKEDTAKFTLLNIVPGLGSMLQGDYYAGAYTLTSVLGSILYNIVGSGTGTDYYFIVNLNGALAYVSSFFAPLRYNQKYNQTVKDKLSL